MKKTIIAFVLLSNLSIAKAALINWEIMFFDNENIQVGQGNFSYDLDTEYIFSSSHPDPSVIPETITVKTAFTTFEWEIEGVIFNDLSAESSWWYGETHSAGSRVESGSHGIYILSSLFHLGDRRFAKDQLNLSLLTTDSTFANGIWELSEFQTLSSTGTFQASIVQTSAVPVPSTIFLLGSGVLGLLGFRRKTGVQ